MSFQDEEALRALVRETIARRIGAEPAAAAPLPGPSTMRGHASHFRYTLTESDGPCLIEPGVQCNHCGYCQSHGH
jgi:hypothetical protein